MTDRHRYEIYEDAAAEYRWRKVAGNGEVTADSGEGYTRSADAVRAAETDRGDNDTAIVHVGDE